jgi:hypothetical protein
MKSKKSAILTGQLKCHKGQAMVESVLVGAVTLVLIFGIMDLARLSWTLHHLYGAVFAAARAESINKSGLAAANLITVATLRRPCYVQVSKSNITTIKKKSYGFFPTIYELEPNKVQQEAIKIKLWYLYDPLFTGQSHLVPLPSAWAALKVIPIIVSCRMGAERPKIPVY